MAKTTVELELVALVSEATKTIKSFSSDTQKQLSSLSLGTSITAINQGFQLIGQTAGRAFNAISGFVSSSVAEAVQGEEALTKLANSMRLVGDFSKGATEEFKNFADQVQKTTSFSDDQVLSSIAIAKNFGLTNAEAKKATEASIQFAAATGIDLPSAVEKVSKSFNGLLDRDLARYLPALKNVTKEQLVLGEAATAVQSRFQGFAEALGQTFQGSLNRADNSFNNFKQSLGDIIINSPTLIGSLQVIGQTFDELSGSVDRGRNGLTGFISEAIKGIVSLVPVTITTIKQVDFLLSSITNLFEATGKFSAGLAAAIQADSEGNSAGARDAAQQSIKDIEDIYSKSQDRQTGFYDPLIKSAQDAADKIQKLDIIPNQKKESKIQIGFNKSDAKIVADRMKNALLEGAEQVKNKIIEAFNKQKEKVGEIAKNPFTDFFPVQKPEDPARLPKDTQNSLARGAGIANAALQGAEGAKSLVKGFVSAAAEALVPGLGAVAGEIIAVLSQGPEKVREQIRAFADAIPEIIKSIALAIPALIEEFSKAIPKIVTGIINELPAIIQELVKELPAVVTSLALQMPSVAIAFVTGLINNIPRMVEGFAREFLKIPERFAKELLQALHLGGGNGNGGLPGSDNFLKGNFSVGRGAADIFTLGANELFGNPFGFADGGRIADNPKFSNDRLSANLSSGEQVLGKDLSSMLEDFLTNRNKQQAAPTTINLQIGQQQLASVLLNLNRSGYRT